MRYPLTHLFRLFALSAPPQRTDEIVDVAVVGSGFAGLAAAIEAANSGRVDRVVVFEKMPTPGGNSIYNAGQVAAVGTSHQSDAGISDSVDTMMDDMLASGLELNHPDLLRAMIESSADTVQWTIDELGVRYRDRLTQLGGHSVPRTLSTENASGRDIIDPMLERVKGHPKIELRTGTKLNDIVMDGERVWGVRVGPASKGNDGDSDAVKNVRCTKGVVLAAGGFGADVAFRSVQDPSLHGDVMSTNQPGATAEVIRDALKVRALPVQLSRIQLVPFTSPDEDGFGMAPFFCLGAGFPYGVVVDPATSKRFMNELGNRYERSMAIIKKGHPVVCITDATGAKHSLEKDFSKIRPAVEEHASLDDLAETYGMDAVTLKETLGEYNTGVSKGSDSFDKPLRDDLCPITTMPLYSVRLWPKVHHCMGGLHINSKAQVMHIDGRPIDGLFAAGEITGGVHGADRLGSCATTDCLAFGRIAGQNVASNDAKPDHQAHASKKMKIGDHFS